MLYYSNSERTLEDVVFDKFHTIEHDEFLVLSGYLGPSPIQRLKEENRNTTIIFGLANEGVQRKLHDRLIELEEDITILVPQIPSHAKIYAWKKEGKFKCILNGSSNFSYKGLNNQFREILEEVPYHSFHQYEAYLKTILESSIRYKDFMRPVEAAEAPPSYALECESPSLYAPGSKINWGHAPRGNVNMRDSYIHVSAHQIRNYPLMFPEKSPLRGLGFNDNDPIEIIWDDGTVMKGLLEGTQTIQGRRYPNKISSYPSKRILGDYLRMRMSLPLGCYVTPEMFSRYGRDTITMSLHDDLYFFDFSSKT